MVLPFIVMYSYTYSPRGVLVAVCGKLLVAIVLSRQADFSND